MALGHWLKDYIGPHSGGSGGGSGGGGTLVVRVDHREGQLPNFNVIFDKTWQEVYDALANGTLVVSVVENSGASSSIAQARIVKAQKRRTSEIDETYEYSVSVFDASSSESLTTLYACSEDGYLQTAQCSSGGNA